MKNLFLVLFVFALALSLTSVAFAQAPVQTISGDVTADTVGTSGTITDTDSLVGIIMGLVNWVAWFVGLLAVLFGLWAGILFITAGGDAAKVTQARDILLYAIVGIAVAILAFSLVAISRSIITP